MTLPLQNPRKDGSLKKTKKRFLERKKKRESGQTDKRTNGQTDVNRLEMQLTQLVS